KQWIEYGGEEIVKDENSEEEYNSLPGKFGKIFEKSFPGKKMKDCVLVRIPKGLTLENLGKVAKKYFPTSRSGYNFLVLPEAEEQVTKSYWVLMPKESIEETKNEKYQKQVEIVIDLGCEIPKALEAAASIFAEYFRSGTRLYAGKENYIRCQDMIDEYHL